MPRGLVAAGVCCVCSMYMRLKSTYAANYLVQAADYKIDRVIWAMRSCAVILLALLVGSGVPPPLAASPARYGGPAVASAAAGSRTVIGLGDGPGKLGF